MKIVPTKDQFQIKKKCQQQATVDEKWRQDKKYKKHGIKLDFMVLKGYGLY